jgi:transcriptional regulator with XRE-family HTH domain
MTPRALKKWRLLLEMSQESFGIWLGVSRTTVNRWEGGLQAIPHMVALLESHYHRPDDIDCGCRLGVQVCDYHMGGRYRTDAERDVAWEALRKDGGREERRVHVGNRRAAGDRRVNRFSPEETR